MSLTVLLVDDEALTLRTISKALGQEGFEVLVATSGEEALEVYASEKPDLVLLDVVLPGMNGTEVLRHIKQQHPAAIVVMMTAYQVVEQAVEAMKLGAYDYLLKPFHLEDLTSTMWRAAETLALRVRVAEITQSAKGRYDFGRIVTRNSRMQEVLMLARKAAESDRTTILIQGESGTGKEVLAKAIHYHSPRSHMPLMEVNCAALPDTLLESELFGFEPGAFTDARRRKEGLLERANGGTVFLDEIGNMSAAVQAKLLRVLEEGTFMHLGGTQPIRVDVRTVAATNRDLKEAVGEGKFREDLFYRLNVVSILIPPLRRRREDVLPLALDILQELNQELKKSFTGFSREAAELLMDYPWPGNVRELRNVIERTMILAPEGDIDVDCLPEELREHPTEREQAKRGSVLPQPQSPRQFLSLKELEDRYIQKVLAATNHNKTRAARILGIHPTSLLRRLKKKGAGRG